MIKDIFNLGSKVQIGKLLEVCPGGRHAWYESNFGRIRKPYQKKTTKTKTK